MAWKDQSQIGFEHLLKGRLSSKWKLAQQCAYDHYPPTILKKYHTGQHWLNAIVSSLLSYSLDLWSIRCELKKGKTVKEKISIQRSKLIPLYQAAFQYLRSTPHLQSLQVLPPIINLIKAPINSIVYWLWTYHSLLLQPHYHDLSTSDPLSLYHHSITTRCQTYFQSDGLHTLHI